MADPLYLTRVDADANMARFYELDVEPSLFGDWVLLRRWARIGTWGRMRLVTFRSQEAAQAGCEAQAGRKRRRGYRDAD